MVIKQGFNSDGVVGEKIEEHLSLNFGTKSGKAIGINVRIKKIL